MLGRGLFAGLAATATSPALALPATLAPVSACLPTLSATQQRWYGRRKKAVPKKIEPMAPPQLSPTDPDNVIPTLVQIQRLLGTKSFVFPRIVVIGNQSAGKSSVLEAIVGEDFLPKGTNMVTRRPLELTLVREATGRWAEFSDGHKIYDFKQVQERILEENLEVEISSDPIQLTIHSPDVHNVTLVDLPGYIHVIKKGQSSDLPQKIEELCKPYIEDKHNIILAVISAVEDVAMSMGVKHAQNVDRDQERSMGVVTKIDMVKSTTNLISTLRGEDYGLGLGYVGVKCRSQKELEDEVTFADVCSLEEGYLQAAKLRTHPDLKLGIPTLRHELSTQLLRRVSHSFPEIIEQLDSRLDKTRKDEAFLKVMAGEKDLTNVAKELEKLVNQFHPTSASRLDFEKNARTRLRTTVAQVWQRAVESTYDFHSMALNHSSEAAELYRPGEGDKTTRELAKRVLSHIKFDPVEKFDMDKFARLFIFGEGTPDKFDDNTFHDLSSDVLTTGLLAPFYAHVLTDSSNREHVDWQRRLEDTVVEVNQKVDLATVSRQMMVEELLEFVDVAARSTKKESEMAKFFFKYLIEKISSRMDDEGLSIGLRAMIRREKRAVADYFDFVNECQSLLKTPRIAQGWSLFGSKDEEKWPLVIPAYGEVWTKAYFNIVIRRCTNDIYRSLAVELLNPMIFEAIHYSLTLFKSGKIFREANAQMKAIKQLEKYRSVIEKAHERYDAGARANPV